MSLRWKQGRQAVFIRCEAQIRSQSKRFAKCLIRTVHRNDKRRGVFEITVFNISIVNIAMSARAMNQQAIMLSAEEEMRQEMDDAIDCQEQLDQGGTFYETLCLAYQNIVFASSNLRVHSRRKSASPRSKRKRERKRQRRARLSRY